MRIVEIPMNPPEPLESLRILTRAYGNRMICGAGTLLDSQTALIASRVFVAQQDARHCEFQDGIKNPKDINPCTD